MDNIEENGLVIGGEGNESGSVQLSYKQLMDIFDFPPPSPVLFYVQMVCAVVYSVLTMAGLCANIIFCCVIWRTEKLHTVTHMLMTNLAVSNQLFLFFHPPYFLSTFILETNWHFGTVICKASYSIPYVTVTASFYFMCLVAIDRWLAIFRRKQRIARQRGIQLTVGAWLIAGIVATPYAYSSQVQSDGGGLIIPSFMTTTRCGGVPVTYQNELLIATFVAQYAIPLIVMVPAYMHLAVFLYRRPTIGIQSREKTKKATMRRKRLIFTLIGILAIQVACWMPLFTVGILHRVYKDIGIIPYIITSTIALLGVLFTPLCYLTNDGFIHQLKQMFPCIYRKKNEAAMEQAGGTTRRLLGDNEMARVPSSSLPATPTSNTPTPKNTRVCQIANEHAVAISETV